MELEKDRKKVAERASIDDLEETQIEEAFLANELTHLHRKRAKLQKQTLNAKQEEHREKLGGIWFMLSKSKTLRDPIFRLKIPGANPTQYERDSNRMAKLAHDYHDELQNKERGLDEETD